MNTNQLIAQAKAEAREWSPRLESAIAEGLIDGDVIHLGGSLYAHVQGVQVAMINNATETGRIDIATMSEQMHDRMLVLKGIRAGRVTI